MDETFIKKLIYRGYEGRNVDYKSSCPWKDLTREKLIKHILCFANVGGGYIVIGYNESKSSEEERRMGVYEEHFDSWEPTKVNEYINNYCKPLINIEVVPFQDKDEDKKYLILDIPSHSESPHICMKEKKDEKGHIILKRGAIYYRTKKDSCDELSEPDYWNELLQRCLRNRREELMKSFEQILHGIDYRHITPEEELDLFKEMNKYKIESDIYNNLKDKKDLIYYEISCYPINYLNSINIDAIDNALKEASVNYRGWPFIFYLPTSRCPPRRDDKKIFAYENEPLIRKYTFYYWAFYHKGIFYSRNLTLESSIDQSKKKFDPIVQSIIIGEAIISIGRLFHALAIPLDKILRLSLRYSHTKKMKVSSVGDYDICESNEFLGENLTYETQSTLSDFLNKTSELTANSILSLNKKLGYQGTLGFDFFKKKVEEHLKKPKFNY